MAAGLLSRIQRFTVILNVAAQELYLFLDEIPRSTYALPGAIGTIKEGLVSIIFSIVELKKKGTILNVPLFSFSTFREHKSASNKLARSFIPS